MSYNFYLHDLIQPNTQILPPVNTIIVTINCYTNPKPRNKIDNGKNLQKLCFISDSHHLPAKYRLLILCTSIRSPYNPPPPQPTKHEKPASRIRHYPHTHSTFFQSPSCRKDSQSAHLNFMHTSAETLLLFRGECCYFQFG